MYPPTWIAESRHVVMLANRLGECQQAKRHSARPAKRRRALHWAEAGDRSLARNAPPPRDTLSALACCSAGPCSERSHSSQGVPTLNWSEGARLLPASPRAISLRLTAIQVTHSGRPGTCAVLGVLAVSSPWWPRQ